MIQSACYLTGYVFIIQPKKKLLIRVKKERKTYWSDFTENLLLAQGETHSILETIWMCVWHSICLIVSVGVCSWTHDHILSRGHLSTVHSARTLPVKYRYIMLLWVEYKAGGGMFPWLKKANIVIWGVESFHLGHAVNLHKSVSILRAWSCYFLVTAAHTLTPQTHKMCLNYCR